MLVRDVDIVLSASANAELFFRKRKLLPAERASNSYEKRLHAASILLFLQLFAKLGRDVGQAVVHRRSIEAAWASTANDRFLNRWKPIVQPRFN